MNALIIYAHPNPFSFNHAIRQEVEELLKQKGYSIKVSDLYNLDFDPVLKSQDFLLLKSGSVADDVKAEQEKVAWASLLVVIHPIWWTGFPAILKGYFDRVFSNGFAFGFEGGTLKKLLDGKRAVVISTHGMPHELYDPAMYDAFRQTQDLGIFSFCGFEVKHIFFSGMAQSTAEQRKGYLSSLKEQLDASL